MLEDKAKIRSIVIVFTGTVLNSSNKTRKYSASIIN